MWEVKKPIFGDHIKVSRGLYSHHGIYASDDCVIHFAPPVNTGAIDPESARIIVTNLSDFLNGGLLEVRSFSLEETKQKRSPQDIVNYAFGTQYTENKITSAIRAHFKVIQHLQLLTGGKNNSAAKAAMHRPTSRDRKNFGRIKYR